ncbi:MASE1 domain-containing protein [Archangium violaceum]|uniref:sensor histidine kinase n=1 Tax=Archangium violaceum TaxID=83451 RepID=UPI00193C0A9E|nr:MASE1 domain-containing protein [Archangium violaceum]QRK11674.1 MASE1 domain-containing protein [Archangium violaceum]
MGQGRPRGLSGGLLGRAVLLFGSYFGLKMLSGVFLFRYLESSAIWLPGGLALAVLLRAPRRRWPVYLASIFLADLAILLFHDQDLDLNVVWALGNLLSAVLGAELMRRWLDMPVTLSRPRDVVALVIAGGLLGPLPSATLGVGVVALFEPALDAWSFWRGFLDWYLADGLGAILVAPLVLSWGAERPGSRRSWETLELAGSMLLLALVAHVTFGVLAPEGLLLSLPYLCLPILLWAALRSGPRGAATATLVLAAFAVWHTTSGRGPFGALPGSVHERVLAVQVFLAVASLSTLVLAAMACERQRVEQSQRVLAEAGAVLAESMDPRDTLPRVARLVVPEVVSGFALWLADEDGRFVPAAREGMTPEEEAGLLVGLRGLTEPSRRHLGPEGASVLVRIQHRGRLLGSLALLQAGHTHPLRPRLVSFAEDLAHHCALALANAHLFEQFQAAIHARDEFIAVAAHELRTPLTALQLQMRSLPRLLQQVPASEPLLARHQSLARQVSRLGRLVESLLDVGRINTGQLRLEREPVDLGELVHDVVEHLSGELERAGCEVSVSAQAHVTGLWDRTRLEQVLTNLLGNALKFGAGQPIELRVETRGSRARLVVTDHGIGMKPEALERIFGRFERAVSSREYGGLGLGLFLTRQIVEAHGGSIQAQGLPGEGATFILELPTSPSPSSPASLQAGSPWALAPADPHPT